MIYFLKTSFAYIIFLTLFATSWAATPTREIIISDIVATSDAQMVNLTLKLNGYVNYQGSVLSNPSRFIIRLKNTKLNASLDQPALHHSHLRSIHSAYNKNTLQMVFEFKQANKIKLKQIRTDDAKQPYNLVLEFIKKMPLNTRLIGDSAFSKAKKDNDLETTLKKIAKQQETTRDIVIAIDPGHGGEDPGAIGPSGTAEKHIVLAIARELENLINNEPGFHAVLTRKSDYFIPLRERLAIARKYKADMLIAVHADAFMNNEARGASVYSLSNRGASSEAARWLAEKENHSELLDGAKLDANNSMLRSVLINLQQTATNNASTQLGARILRYLGRHAKLHHNKIEQAAFVVLKSPDISSLLIETGFISNYAEEKLLNDRPYQHKLALAITEGIKDYYHLRPPGGTFLSALTDKDNPL